MASFCKLFPALVAYLVILACYWKPEAAITLDLEQFFRVDYLFSGKRGGCITRQTADAALRKACDLLGFEGYSTHSFRRTALTRLSNAGVPLRVIQEISGHADLGVLQKYLAVSPEQVKDAISHI